jgi:hypothetical protein
MSAASYKIGSKWLHLKTDTVYVIRAYCIIEATKTPAVLYQNAAGGPLWVRPSSEFFDGRFLIQT